MGKYILPWFGGSPGVWTTCLLFFQTVLLGGYAYAHFTSRWFKPRAQAGLHLVLAAAAVALPSITPGDAWKPHGGGNPTSEILLLLLANLGLPYFVLSSTGPLMQQWWSRIHPGASPYRLYALSNVGSLLALVSYPFFFETHFTRKTQAMLWSCGLVIYALGCVFCALKLWKVAGVEAREPAANAGSRPVTKKAARKEKSAADLAAAMSPGPPPSTFERLLWLLLPACASMLLLATTNMLCLDMAVIPFLWVLPLGLYLTSFIISFDHPRWYRRYPFLLALLAGLCGLGWAVRAHDWSISRLVTVYSGALFACCMVCHGELYRLRPDPRHLTGFYLMIAAGGALGGAFVALLAPVMFTGYHELYLGALLCALLFLAACLHDKRPGALKHWRWMACTLPFVGLAGFESLLLLAQRFLTERETTTSPIGGMAVVHLVTGMVVIVVLVRAAGRRQSEKPASGIWDFVVMAFAPWAGGRKFSDSRHCQKLAVAWLALVILELGAAFWFQQEKFTDRLVVVSRNFYGVLRVFDHRQGELPEHILWVSNGKTLHGAQFSDPPKMSWPTIYYGEQSGVGMAMRALPAGNRRLGLVGLGAGTLCTYAQASDDVHVYEINPEMQRLAATCFTYLSNCPAKVEITLGDARVSLEREPPQNFDLLVLDAFSSDAIPVHLLTAEAFEVYDRHLKTNGIIAIHISNKWLNLEPVVANVARRFNYRLVVIDHVPSDEQWWLRRSLWALLAHDDKPLDTAEIRNAGRAAVENPAKVPLWTDDFSSLFQVLQ